MLVDWLPHYTFTSALRTAAVTFAARGDELTDYIIRSNSAWAPRCGLQAVSDVLSPFRGPYNASKPALGKQSVLRARLTALLSPALSVSRTSKLDPSCFLLSEEGLPCPAPSLSAVQSSRSKAEEAQDDGHKMMNEYACRLLELLGMGHRLFVPRLLPVSIFSLRD